MNLQERSLVLFLASGFFCFFFHYLVCSLGLRGKLVGELSPQLLTSIFNEADEFTTSG